MKQLIVNREKLQTRIALIDERGLQEYYIERDNQPRIVGSIFKGRIRNLEPSLQAAFVDIGFEKNAFLHYWDMLPATADAWEGGDDDEDEADDAAADDDEPPPPGRREAARRPPPAANRPRPAPAAPPASAAAGTAGSSTLTGKLRQFFGRGSGGPPGSPEGPPPGAAETAPLADDPQAAPGDEAEPEEPERAGRRRPRRPPRQYTVEDVPNLFAVNTDVTVQVSKGTIGDKGPRVTTNLSLPGRYTVLLPNSSHRGVSKRIEDRRERQRLRDMVRRLDILPSGTGCICRTASIGLSFDGLRKDVQQLLEIWREAERRQGQRAPCCVYREPGILERTIRDLLAEGLDEIVVDAKDTFELALGYVKRLEAKDRPRVRFHDDPTPIFEKFKIEDQIEAVFQRTVVLPSGVELCVDETEALIAIDINSGKNRAGKDHPETILTTNLEAADEIGRQLRLRNVGGLVVIDFIDMRARRDQHRVYQKMREVLSRDRARTRMLPISRLGLMQLTRQREHESLQSTMYEKCRYCHGRGLVKSSASISVEIQRRLQELLRRAAGHTPIRVMVHPRVLTRLRQEDADILQAMEEEYGGDLSFRADPKLHQEEFHLIDTRTGKEL